MTIEQDAPQLRDRVRDRYAAAAARVLDSATTGSVSGSGGGCCGPAADGCCGSDVAEAGEGFGSKLYSTDEQGELPAAAVEASLGCGNPLMVADLNQGETVLDLGSGGGIDVLLSARRVG